MNPKGIPVNTVDPDLTRAIESVGDFLHEIEQKFTAIHEICKNYQIDAMTYIEWTHMSMACEEVMALSEEIKRTR